MSHRRFLSCLLLLQAVLSPLSSLSKALSTSSAALGSHEADLVVIGSGPGGYVGAIKAAQLGMKVEDPPFPPRCDAGTSFIVRFPFLPSDGVHRETSDSGWNMSQRGLHPFQGVAQ